MKPIIGTLWGVLHAVFATKWVRDERRTHGTSTFDSNKQRATTDSHLLPLIYCSKTCKTTVLSWYISSRCENIEDSRTFPWQGLVCLWTEVSRVIVEAEPPLPGKSAWWSPNADSHWEDHPRLSAHDIRKSLSFYIDVSHQAYCSRDNSRQS